MALRKQCHDVASVLPIDRLLDAQSGKRTRNNLFLFFLSRLRNKLYGYYHVVLQHYGFLALSKPEIATRVAFGRHTTSYSFTSGCWLPTIYLCLTHPKAEAV